MSVNCLNAGFSQALESHLTKKLLHNINNVLRFIYSMTS